MFYMPCMALSESRNNDLLPEMDFQLYPAPKKFIHRTAAIFYYRFFHTLGVSKNRIGKISRRPKSISKHRINLEMAEKKE